MSYVIRNCPAKPSDIKATYGWCSTYQIKCHGCTDCVMKQIVEKCKRTLSINKGFENEFTLGKMTFAEFILKDLDIQEVE